MRAKRFKKEKLNRRNPLHTHGFVVNEESIKRGENGPGSRKN